MKENRSYVKLGEIQSSMRSSLDMIRDEFYKQIPGEDKKKSTYHLWYHELPHTLKGLVTDIQRDPFWNMLCEGKSKCVINNVAEMDELYYSKAPPKMEAGSLKYGASTNYDLHIDGMFQFPGITFVRVLIGLTSGNTTVKTVFPEHKESAYLNKDKYIAFDFDNAPHQVVNTSDDPTNYRTMLKLHFSICESCEVGSTYQSLVNRAYIGYERVTRYVMKTGTNPETWYQFFLGLFCNLYCAVPLLIKGYLLLLAAWLVLRTKRRKQIPVLRTTVLGGAALYLVVVTLFWLRYTLTGKR